MLPTIGSKELVAWLPDPARPRPGRPRRRTRSWPTRRTRSGAALAGAARVAQRRARPRSGPQRVSLVWLNSPSNPTGRVLPADHLRKVVAWAASAARCWSSDECYLELRLGRRARSRCCTPTSATATTRGHPRGALAVQALQPGRLPGALRRRRPRAGRPSCCAVRKHLGLHGARRRCRRRWRPRSTTTRTCAEQRARYAARRGQLLRTALEGAGFRIDHSEASLYLWATRDEPCWDTVGVAGRPRHPGRARATSTARPAPGTCGSRSPRPTSGSRPPSTTGSAERRRRRAQPDVLRRSHAVAAIGVGARQGRRGGEHLGPRRSLGPHHRVLGRRRRPAPPRRRRCAATRPSSHGPSTRMLTGTPLSCARFSAVPIV